MLDKKTYLSKAKHDELVQELSFLEGTRRKEIAKQLEQAKEYGDLSENAEYHQAREAQATVEARIFQLEEMLKTVEIVSRHTSDKVEVGTTAIIRKDGDEDDKTFEIVGSEEADTSTHRISLDSPLGQALLGKKKGDIFTFKTPSGKSFKYKVMMVREPLKDK